MCFAQLINKKSRHIQRRCDDGYSLIELAIALVIIGLVIVPAITLYRVQVVQERIDRTEAAVNRTTNAIGGFRSVFGRYPCPAPLDAPRGDVRYGLEDCTLGTFGSCVGGTCTTASNRIGIGEILIGALPFKTLNMQEFEAYDAYGSRLVYGVTYRLTNVGTFDMGAGGITILDKNGDQMTDIEDSAHFTVISYGEDPVGAYSRMGEESSDCAGTGLEIQNCDMDETFVFGEIEDGFDHYMDFFSSVTTSEWQISETDAGDIHVRNAANIAIGASLVDDPDTASDDLLLSESAAVRSTSADEGRIRARQNFLSGNLCEYDATNPSVDCFSPSLIGGQLQDVSGVYQTSAIGVGMSCGNEFLVGIQNGQPVCSSDVVLTCPAGDFLVGVNSSGEIICNSQPIECNDTDVVSWCGDTVTIPATYDGGYSVTYSGQCYKTPDYDSAYFASTVPGKSFTEVADMIDVINNESRTQVDCNAGNTGSQIRETYQCNAGTFSHILAHEKGYPWSSHVGNITQGWPLAGPNTQPYEPYGGSLAPSGANDCWCREDYRASQIPCGANMTGNITTIAKHSCPQTYNWFQGIYNDTSNCVCQPGTSVQYKSCASYYYMVNGTSGFGLSGIVTLTYDVTCVDNKPVTSASPIAVDASQCACNVSSFYPYVWEIPCPTGTTNNFTWSWPGLGSQNAVGKSSIYVSNCVCPGTTTGGLPDPYECTSGLYSPIPACTCDSSLKTTETLACPAGLTGGGLVYEKEWDCSLNGGAGGWEPQSGWTLVEDKCSACGWQKPSGPSEFREEPIGQLVGSTCSCGSDPSACRDYASGGYN
ncbi:MAG: prepilin-type N-terminal cleavage/methylation domain-containing protein, partial [Alphaproteobacteria bacterium]|nr:prepilin-type N-terminal cleavage/methylation domain-containing protein [Alphaproteobacteria bacterium]